MKYLQPITLLFSFFVLATSCDKKEEGTLDYSILKYDTSSLAIFKWDTTKYTFPPNSNPLPLTQKDINITDSILKNLVDSFNRNESSRLYEDFSKQFPVETFTINLEKYKRQYYPYKDVNGQKVVYVISFCDEYTDWKHEIYSGRKHGGICRFDVIINLSESSSNDFMISGYG